MKRLSKLLPLGLPLLVLVSVLVLQLQVPGLFLTLRNYVFDSYQAWQPRQTSMSQVLIVDIDEASLRRLGQWPWPRAKLAALIDRLGAMGVAAVALDLLLVEPDRSSALEYLSQRLHEPEIRRLVELLPDNDRLLAEAMARESVSVGFFLSPDSIGDRAPEPKAGFAFAGPDPTHRLSKFEGALTAIPELEAGARGNGSLNFIPGLDGRVRRVPLLVRYQDALYPGIAAEALRLASGRPSYFIKSLSAGENLLLRVGKETVPLNRGGELWLYYSKPRTSNYIPAWQVLEGDLEPDRVKNAIVLVGTTAAGIADQHQSALGDSISGVEIHAQIIEQVLGGAFLNRPQWAVGAELVVQVLIAVVLIILVAYGGAIQGALFSGIAILAAFFGSAFAFSQKGWLLDPLSASVTLLTVYVFASVMRYVRTEKERRFIQRAFSSYVSPNLVRHLIKHPDDLRLGGERRECSFVLTDLADFTPLIEGADPADLTVLINEYIDRMTAIAFAHDGTLDRIVGDAVAVMFSAPVVQPDHARRAVDCALAMDAFAQEFSQRKRKEGLPIGNTRIGVHTGSVIVGNFGGRSQLDYRALGDAINTASRLEGANKYLGTRVCVSGATVRQYPGFVGRPVGFLQLKGKTQGIEAYEPLTPVEAEAPAVLRYLESYRLLEQCDDGAERSFELLARQFPDDRLIEFHLRRLHDGERGTIIVFRTK